MPVYREFLRAITEWTDIPCPLSDFLRNPSHSFAVFFQLLRGFDLIVELVRCN